MVTRFGMSEVLGAVTYDSEASTFLGVNAEYHQRAQLSEETLKEIDYEIKDLVRSAEKKATAILEKYRSTLVAGAELLLINETLSKDQLDQIFPKRKDAGHLKLIS